MTAMHDRPTVIELIEAVREFIESDVMSATEGPLADSRLRFHTRVAVNALHMVERELRDGPEQAAEHARRLAELGFATDAELAAAIREGRLDERYDEVKAAVTDAVRDKLRVANPRYLDT